MWEKITELISSLQPETIKDTIVAIFSCAGGLIGALMGDHLYLLQWLCYFVAADWLTGFYAAKRTKTYASAVGHAGLAKKLLIIFVAIGFHGVDQILDMPFIGVWAVGALAINELIWILETSRGPATVRSSRNISGKCSTSFAESRKTKSNPSCQ